MAKRRPISTTRTITAVLSTFSGSGAGAPEKPYQRRIVLVVCDTDQTFRDYRDAMKTGPSPWMWNKEYIHATSMAVLRSLDPSEVQLSFVGRYWESPVYNSKLLHNFTVPGYTSLEESGYGPKRKGR